MMNLKKTLAVVLAFVMVLSMGAISTFAYSDVTAGTITDEAVSVLSGLNIITGFEDGTFRPEETVTRAQMAAIICRTLGYESQAASSKGFTVFNDVAADHWASGYVNVAQAQGIINGYGNGNFGPEDKVTYEQAVKMIVSALGYDLPAAQKGGYPTGYLAIASAQGITKNANGRVGDAAARATIAVLVYNALEVDLFEQDSWSTDGGDSFSGAADNVLTRYLDIQKFEGVVTATPLTAATSSYKKDDKAKFTLSSAEYWYYSDGDFVLGTAGIPSTTGINASLVDDVNKFLGKKVVAYIGEYADNTTGDRMLYAIAEKNGSNETMTINVAQLTTGTTANKLEYKVPGSNKTYDVALNPALTGYVNFTSYDNSTTALSIKTASTGNDSELATDDFAALAPTGGSIELIDSNPAVAGYDVAIITKYNAEAVVKAVENVRDVVKFDNYVGTIAKFDTEAEDELAIVYKDGVLASIEDIAAGDTVNVAQVNANKVRVFYVSSASVTGAVEGYQAAKNEVYIGGETYKPSIASGYAGNLGTNNAYDLKGKEGIFYLNVDGMIAYADASAAKGNYALILDIGNSGSRGKYSATLALADGTVASYDLATKLVWNTGAAQDALTVANAVLGIMNTTNAAPSYTLAAGAYTHADVAAKLLCTVKLNNDGEIKSLVQVNSSAAAPGSASKYSEETVSLGSKSFDETSVMFALKQVASGTGYDAKVESSDVQVGTVADFLVDEEQYYVTAYDMDANTTIYAAALGYNLVAAIPVDSDALIVSSTSVKSYNDDEAVVVNGIQAGEEVSYVLYNENGFRTANAQATGADATEISVGDVILVSAPDADGIVGDFQMLYKKIASTNFTTGIKVSNNANGKQDYYHVALVDETVPASNSYIWLASAGTGVTTTEGGKHYFVMQRAANYTLVDYTEDAVEPEVMVESANKYFVGDFAEETTTIFVRVIDEKVVDVVAYRTKP